METVDRKCGFVDRFIEIRLSKLTQINVCSYAMY